MQIDTNTSAEVNPRGMLPLSEIPGTFHVCSMCKNESLDSQWATATARPLWTSDSRRMPQWEGLITLYSFHTEVLTHCVGPLTPHLLSPLMWLYWLWHTGHGDDDQTIESAPRGRAIRVANHSTGFVCLSVCVSVCMGFKRVTKCYSASAVVDKWGG